MQCLACDVICFGMICKACERNLLKPNFYTRDLDDGFKIYSFYGYDELQKLIMKKYEFVGDRVFKILASLSFKKFAESFSYAQHVFALGIDDHTRHGFSQNAILTRALTSAKITPLYAKLRAKNRVSYAGKDLSFRQNNPRNLIYTGKSNIPVILVDDVVTTGTTMKEAKRVVMNHNCEVLFGLVLCDAKI